MFFIPDDSEEDKNEPIKCRDGWTHYDGYCYYVSTEKLNWVGALNDCFVNQSSLIDIDSYPSYPSRLFGFLKCIGSFDHYWV